MHRLCNVPPIPAARTRYSSLSLYANSQRTTHTKTGDALKKAEEENSDDSEEDSDDSVTDSNEDLDGFESEDTESSESEDTLDEYGFPNDKKPSEKFLFQGDYAPNSTKLADHSYSDIENKSDIDSNAGDIEMEQIAKPRAKKRRKKRQKSKHKLQGHGDPDRKSKKPKKKKKKKFNNKMWQTIVLATSPTEDTSMLFEEGPASKQGQGPQQSGGRVQRPGSIAIDMTNKGKGPKNSISKSQKSGKPKSPRSPTKKISFAKLNPFKQSINSGDNAGDQNGDNAAPKPSN